MSGLVKAQAGSLIAALSQCTLLPSRRQAQRTAALRAVRFAGDADGLSVITTSFDGTIKIRLAEAESDGEIVVRLEPLADLVRHFPLNAKIAVAADDVVATVTSGRSKFTLPVFPIADLLEPRILGEETGRVELDAKITRDLFVRPAFAAAEDVSRPYLRGIFLHNVGDSLVAVAGCAALRRRPRRPSRRITS
jgi:DNA polymerase III sliding clamp (beta) subunit (PCNA family)